MGDAIPLFTGALAVKPRNVLTEAQLRDNVQSGAVRALHIVRQTSGNYHVHVRLSWKTADCLLITSRKAVREWSSLDRLARRIATHYGVPPCVTLTLDQTELVHDR